jgi:hypothetical protein
VPHVTQAVAAWVGRLYQLPSSTTPALPSDIFYTHILAIIRTEINPHPLEVSDFIHIVEDWR